jgi:hypothetical protein
MVRALLGGERKRRRAEKAVDIPKKALDIASYKLYYVNYEAGKNSSSTTSS